MLIKVLAVLTVGSQEVSICHIFNIYMQLGVEQSQTGSGTGLLWFEIPGLLKAPCKV